jgi:hypothetical protein
MYARQCVACVRHTCMLQAPVVYCDTPDEIICGMRHVMPLHGVHWPRYPSLVFKHLTHGVLESCDGLFVNYFDCSWPLAAELRSMIVALSMACLRCNLQLCTPLSSIYVIQTDQQKVVTQCCFSTTPARVTHQK